MSTGGRLGSVIVIAKRPVPGRVKTRLSPPLTPEQAADVAAAALRDTLDAVVGVDASEHVLAFSGRPDGWVRPGWRCVDQPSGGLDVRLVDAFVRAPRGPAVLVGMDTPQLRAEHIAAFDTARYDACLGLSTDGGYWAIGFADPSIAAQVIRGVPMSRADTGAHQRERLDAAKLRVQELDVLTDVDTIDTARQVAAIAPHTEFADTLARCVRAA